MATAGETAAGDGSHRSLQRKAAGEALGVPSQSVRARRVDAPIPRSR